VSPGRRSATPRSATVVGAGERGSGTVLTLGLVAAALVLIAGVALLAGAQAARGAAQAAADLGALAAAEQLAALVRPGGPQGWVQREVQREVAGQAGADAACAIAREVVAANGAGLTGCALLGGGVVRVTAVRPGAVGAARATARAGPESAARG